MKLTKKEKKAFDFIAQLVSRYDNLDFQDSNPDLTDNEKTDFKDFKIREVYKEEDGLKSPSYELDIFRWFMDQIEMTGKKKGFYFFNQCKLLFNKKVYLKILAKKDKKTITKIKSFFYKNTDYYTRE